MLKAIFLFTRAQVKYQTMFTLDGADLKLKARNAGPAMICGKKAVAIVHRRWALSKRHNGSVVLCIQEINLHVALRKDEWRRPYIRVSLLLRYLNHNYIDGSCQLNRQKIA
jgi:hypothetical protein